MRGFPPHEPEFGSGYEAATPIAEAPKPIAQQLSINNEWIAVPSPDKELRLLDMPMFAVFALKMVATHLHDKVLDYFDRKISDSWGEFKLTKEK